jgi:hypothetical protein
MVSGLLLIALMFFVFAQAAFTRSGGQSAADAAALAAAKEGRERLYDRFLDAIDGGGDLGDILAGEGYRTGAACDAAAELAARNSADVISCVEATARPGYRVEIRTRDSVGESVIPGTEDQTAQASATAVITGICRVGSEDEDRIELDCDEGSWGFDPRDYDELPEPRDLFKIHLED